MTLPGWKLSRRYKHRPVLTDYEAEREVKAVAEYVEKQKQPFHLVARLTKILLEALKKGNSIMLW
jgi:hypothetical protein